MQFHLLLVMTGKRNMREGFWKPTLVGSLVRDSGETLLHEE